MMNNTQKTIPYKLSSAELENLRLLRKRMNPAGSIRQDDAQEQISEAIKDLDSHVRHQNDCNEKGHQP
jgi:hypothetical protein